VAWLSPIRVVEQSSNRLVIVDPPYYLLGGIFLIAAIGLSFWGVFAKKSGNPAWDWRVSVLAIPFALVGLVQLTGLTVVVFSRETGKMVLDRRYAGITVHHEEIAIERIVGSGVASNENNHSLFVELNSGETRALTGNSDRIGHNAAAAAIERFLQRR